MNIVVVPDYQGQASRSGFAGELLAVVDEGTCVLMVINGGTGPEIAQAVAANDARERVVSLVCEAGFNTAVMAGMRGADAMGASAVVRIDTAEHPLTEVMASFAMLAEADVVVRDLAFDAATLRAGSADEYHNLEVIPAILGRFTGGHLPMSGAHGFMAFRGEGLTELLDEAQAVLERAAARRGSALMWGADTAIAVVAANAGRRVKVVKIDAELLRDRPTAKCAQQLHDTLDIALALE